jgi:hypothetical protein
VSAYSEAIALEVCAGIAAGGSLRSICKRPGMPAIRTVTAWQAQYPLFAQQLDRARVARADSRIERISELSRAVEAGQIDPNAARVAIDAEKWLAGREHFAKWGDRQALAIANIPSPAETAQANTSERDEFFAKLRRLRDRMVESGQLAAGVSPP